MKILSAIAAVSFAASVCAQVQTLSVDPAGIGLTYTNPGANFFDLDVTNPAGVTLQELTVQLNSPAGTVGSIELWTTATTHIGNENNTAVWQQRATGTVTAAATASICLNPIGPNTLFLPTGTYGIAVVYVDVNHVFDGTLTYPTGPYFDANISIDNGTTQANAWTSAPLNAFQFGNPAVQYNGTLMQFDVAYSVGPIAHACATCGTSGEGSNIHSASTYQLFGEPTPNADASAALQGKVMTFIPNGSGTGYIVTDGTGTGPVYVPPSGLQTALPQMDNQEVGIQTALLYQFPGDTGTQLTQDFFINDNGYVSLEQAQTAFASAPREPQAIMQGASAAYYAFHDYDNSEAGSGDISWEEDLINGILYVTWDNVEGVPNTVANPSTIQFQFEAFTGLVHIVFDLIDPVGGSNVSGGDNTMIGWSPAGPSPRTDAMDFTTLVTTPITLSQPEVMPFTLESVGPPIIGASFDLLASNEPTASIGVNLLSTSTLPAPIDLVALGAPAGTLTYLDAGTSILNTISNIPGVGAMSLTLPVANNPALSGLQIHSQAFWLDLAGTPAIFGNLISSNLVTCTVGNF